MYRRIGDVNGSFTATAGTISLGRCRQILAQAILDGNSGYEIAVKPTKDASGTCSKGNCSAVLTDNGTYETVLGSGNWYLAYRCYNGATAAAGTSTNLYAVEKRG